MRLSLDRVSELRPARSAISASLAKRSRARSINSLIWVVVGLHVKGTATRVVLQAVDKPPDSEKTGHFCRHMSIAARGSGDGCGGPSQRAMLGPVRLPRYRYSDDNCVISACPAAVCGML